MRPPHLKRDDVSTIMADFFNNALFPVLPVEGPAGAVSVKLPGCVFITQDIITHHCEDGYN